MQLTLYMLRSDLHEGSWGLRESADDYSVVPIRPIEGVDATLRVKQSDPHPPRWLRDLMSIVASDDLSTLFNRHTAALLLIRYAGYRFVLAYGAGWHAIDPSAIEPGFGLRVVANSVASSRVRSADTRGLGGSARSQRTAMPAAGPLYELGIEPSEEWVRQLEGTPTVDFANAAAGSDALKLKLRHFSLVHLEPKLAQIIDRYESTDYKREYDFLDYFTRVHRENKSLRITLASIITDMINGHSTDLDFAAPDILEPLKIDYYQLSSTRRKSPEMSELSQDRVYSSISDWKIDEPLTSIRVHAFDIAGEQPITSYPLFDYIVADIRHDGRHYTLSAGQWFVVDETYVEAVQHRMKSLDDITDALDLGAWGPGEDEGSYNRRLAGDRGWKLLDKDNFPIGGPNQKIEICDVLTAERQMICVKRMSKSSTLSHLFAQGSVSAQLLVSDANGYKHRVMEAFNEIAPGQGFGQRDDWTVVYAIGTSKPGKLADTLYFFSKVSLERAVRHLQSLGIRVALARIPMQST